MRVEERLFSLELPPGWRWLPDPEGGAAVPPGEPGALFVSAQEVEDPEGLPSLRRMLAGFLTVRGQPITPLDVKSVSLGRFQGYGWRYVEEEGGGAPHAWSLWVTGTPEAWALISYNCPASCLAVHQAAVLEILATFELGPRLPAGAGGEGRPGGS